MCKMIGFNERCKYIFISCAYQYFYVFSVGSRDGKTKIFHLSSLYLKKIIFCNLISPYKQFSFNENFKIVKEEFFYFHDFNKLKTH